MATRESKKEGKPLGVVFEEDGRECMLVQDEAKIGPGDTVALVDEAKGAEVCPIEMAGEKLALRQKLGTGNLTVLGFKRYCPDKDGLRGVHVRSADNVEVIVCPYLLKGVKPATEVTSPATT